MSRKPTSSAVSRSLQEWVPRGSASISIPTPTSKPTPPLKSNPKPNPRHRKPPPPPPVEDEGVPQLVQEIQDKLARGNVECMICYEMVRRSAPIWSCSSCYSLFHLSCIRKWARSPTSAANPSSSAASSWRCPGCQSGQSLKPEELHYFCFCGRRRDPPNDLYITPHSCGEPCCKPLDRGLNPPENEFLEPCPHVCVLPCHPGPCPPCKAFAPRQPCPCRKKTVVRRCSDRSSPLSCSQVCDRLLSCERHRCEKICHTGACSPCRVLLTAPCFCFKSTETLICGDLGIKGEVSDSEGIFSCGSVCGKLLSCGNHQCGEQCHPGPCGECELLPEKIKTCHCGKIELSEPRKSCLDPIPTCSKACEKPLLCGVHRCLVPCHEGACPPCLTQVEQRCRCGASTRTVECFETLGERNDFTCEKPCGKKKGCGRHRCSEKCCPLLRPGGQLAVRDWDSHLCSIPCGKRLQCGQHSCQLLCHSGHCPQCFETIFTDLSCACGKTFIPPPMPCGTAPPTCPHPCLVPQPCGHSAAHACHFGDCPPCPVPVAKECIGGHVHLRNIPCGSKDIRCNQLCGKTRQCGVHACMRTCHPPPCDPSLPSGSDSGAKSCGQVCGGPRRDCKHTCRAACHPSALCPELRCEFPVTVTCSCGRITADVPCSAGGCTNAYNVDPVFEASIIQKLPAPLQPLEANGKKLPLGQRKLTCDEECAKLERKRVLAEAFDIAPPSLDALHFGENGAATEVISDLFRRDPKWVLSVEERCKFLVRGKAKGNTPGSLKVHVFCHMVKEKRDAVRQIAERWKLSVRAAGWEPKRFVVVHVTPKSKPPARILGSKPGIPVTALPHPPLFDALVDMDPRLVISMLDLPRDADISALVLRFGGECELVWLNNQNALVVFGDPMRVATALRRLEHGSVYHGAVLVPQNGGKLVQPASNAWGEAAKSSSNPWRKALTSKPDSWGGDWSSAADGAAYPAWRGNEAAPVVPSTNRWNVLFLEAPANPVVASEPGLVGGWISAPPRDFGEDTVDDWEEACE